MTLHVITAPDFVTGCPITDCNCCNEAPVQGGETLQNGPVITCNAETVIGPLVMDAEKRPFSAREDREIRVSTPVSSCLSEEPSDDFDERSRRYAEAHARVLAAMPTTCPVAGCGGALVPLSFDVEDRRYDCARCYAIVDAAEGA